MEKSSGTLFSYICVYLAARQYLLNANALFICQKIVPAKQLTKLDTLERQMAKFGYRPPFTLICWFFGDKLGEKLATVWDWLWPGSPGELWLASVWSHCSTAGHWLGLCNPLKCSVKWGYILVVSTGSELRRCIRNRRGLWKNIWKLMRSVELRILNGLEGEDPPEVAQETPIFGRTHHLTNTRVKISMMPSMRMRRTHKK